MRREPFNLALRPLDHPLQVDNELLVYRVVRCAKRVEGGRAGSVEDSEHGKVFEVLRPRLALLHKPRVPAL